MEIFEAMETCRAIRYFKSDPVDQALIDKVLYAATRAPSPGNTQGWDLVVITDPDRRATLGQGIAAIMAPAVEHATKAFAGPEGGVDPVQKRMLDGALNLANRLHEIPVHILVCGRAVYPPDTPDESFVWSALYPATQNILLAARSLGLGTCLTTYQKAAEPLIREVLAIPDDVYIGAYIPMGWPDRSFGQLARKPLDTFVHTNGW
ncbi:MAG: nitroreductase family protein [Pseudomonadales bacterium]